MGGKVWKRKRPNNSSKCHFYSRSVNNRILKCQEICVCHVCVDYADSAASDVGDLICFHFLCDKSYIFIME